MLREKENEVYTSGSRPPSAHDTHTRTRLCLALFIVVSTSWIFAWLNVHSKDIYYSDRMDQGHEVLLGEDKRTDTEHNPFLDYTEDPDPFAPYPRLCLLMTFPNSGTTATHDSIPALSGFAVGTTYMIELNRTKEIDPSDLIYPSSPHGPYWRTNGIHHTPDMKSYVLVKTHCGLFCFKCGPRDYVAPYSVFETACRTDLPSPSSLPYNRSYVSRVVRVFRHPLDNIVSRFHHERNNRMTVHEQDSIYPNNRTGFVRFCHDTMTPYRQEEEVFFQEQNLVDLLHDIPCAGDFFRLVQWHNLANQFIHEYKVPTLILYYERYLCVKQPDGTRISSTSNPSVDLLKFLNLQPTSHTNYDSGSTSLPCLFGDLKTYHHFYSHEEKVKIWTLIKRVASTTTMILLKPYRSSFEQEE